MRVYGKKESKTELRKTAYQAIVYFDIGIRNYKDKYWVRKLVKMLVDDCVAYQQTEQYGDDYKKFKRLGKTYAIDHHVGLARMLKYIFRLQFTAELERFETFENKVSNAKPKA